MYFPSEVVAGQRYKCTTHDIRFIIFDMYILTFESILGH